MKSLNAPANALVAFGALLWIPQAGLIAWCINALAQDPSNFSVAVQAACGVVVLGMFKATLESWGNRLIFRTARQQLAALRQTVSQSLCARSPLDKTRPASGMAASVVAEQAEAIIPWLTRYQPAQWRTMVVPLVILVVVGYHSWLAAVILLASAPMIPLFMAVVGWRAKAVSEAQMLEMGNINAFLLDRLRGLTTLRALGAVGATEQKLRTTGELLKDKTMAVLRIAFLSSAVLELFSALGVALVAVYIGFHLLGEVPFGAYGQQLTLGQGFFILMLAPSFFEPLRDLSAAWHDRASGQAAMEGLEALGKSQETIVASAPESRHQARAQTAGPEQGTPPSAAHGARIDVEGLTYAHQGEKPVFQALSLHIEAGEHVALTGPSGSGKSVLLALIAGLVRPQAGHIAIDGVPLGPETIDGIRASMGWMGQKPHIFTGSSHTNTTLGRERIDEARLHHTLTQSGIDRVIARLPHQILGEGGTGLSGGEIIRLALARLAANPDSTLLLLDEPTSHLDTETAHQVIDTIVDIAHGKTLIVATHDPLMIARLGRTIELPAHALPPAPEGAAQEPHA